MLAIRHNGERVQCLKEYSFANYFGQGNQGWGNTLGELAISRATDNGILICRAERTWYRVGTMNELKGPVRYRSINCDQYSTLPFDEETNSSILSRQNSRTISSLPL